MSAIISILTIGLFLLIGAIAVPIVWYEMPYWIVTFVICIVGAFFVGIFQALMKERRDRRAAQAADSTKRES